MGLKRFAVQNKGMSQDVSISKETQEFAFKNYNIRIQATDDNTLLSVTNIKGPKQYAYHYLNGVTHNSYFTNLIIGGSGTIVGHCIAGDYLVIFITNIPDALHPGATFDEILRLEPTDTTHNFGTEQRPDFWPIVDVKVLAKGNLNFHLDKKINALYYYESQKVQKVYWVDGWYSDEEIEADSSKVNNFPRVINILREDIADSVDKIQALSIFPPIGNPPTVEVEKLYSQPSQLPAGVIQYFISYYNYNAAETSIVQTTPLYSIDFSNRGASPEETGGCAFQLTISGLNDKYDFVRVYSACRTSQDAEPIVSIVGDYAIGSSTSVTLIDNGINQENVDPTMLYYIGGSALYTTTITQKDNTAFYGNIKDAAIYFTDSEIAALESAFHYDLENDTDGSGICTSKILEVSKKTLSLSPSQFGNYYTYRKQEQNNKTFKAGEIYRFAIRFQNSFGAWSNPIWCGDLEMPAQTIPIGLDSTQRYAQVNNVVTKLDADENPQNLESLLSDDIKNLLSSKNIVNYEILMADAELSNGRKIVTQGIVNPVLFNPKQREKNAPYCLPSWIARPVKTNYVPWHHMEALNNARQINAEVQITDYLVKDGKGKYPQPLQLVAATRPFNKDYGIVLLSVGYEPNTTPARANAIVNIAYGAVNAENTDSDFYDTNYSEDDPKIVFLYRERKEIANINTTSGITEFNAFIKDFLIRCHSNITPFYYAAMPSAQNQLYSNFLTDMANYYHADHWKPITAATNRPVLSQNYSWYHTERNVFWIPLLIYTNSTRTAYYESFSYNPNTPIDYNLSPIAHCPYSLPVTLRRAFVDTGEDPIDVFGESSSLFIATEEINGTFETDTNNFYIDSSIATLNSPDVEINESLIKDSAYSFRIIGNAYIGTNYADAEITASPGLSEESTINKFKINSYLHEDFVSIKTSKTPWLLSEYLYKDYLVTPHRTLYDTALSWTETLSDYKIYMWHKQDSIIGIGNKDAYYNNSEDEEDKVTEPYPSILKNKIFFNHRTAIANIYNFGNTSYGEVNCKAVTDDKITFRENNKTFTYFSNYDDLITSDNVEIITDISSNNIDPTDIQYTPATVPAACRIKFNSTSHVLFSLGTSEYNGKRYINILPFSTNEHIYDMSKGKVNISKHWGEDNCFDINTGANYGENYLVKPSNTMYNTAYGYYSPVLLESDDCIALIGELYLNIPYNQLYGGYDSAALKRLSYLPISSISNINSPITITNGDTYYQMYDCLKTYPSTTEDFENNVIDITSVMIETHYNLDGRYDDNRGSFNIMTRPSNFNLYNLVYSQKDNLFQYNINDSSLYSNEYPQQISWTLVKNYIGDIDTWTAPSLANITTVNHPITQLINFNNSIVALTEHDIERVNYNEKNMIQTEDGSFIELQNSNKVNGTTKFQFPFGTHNQTYQITEKGLYFVEDNENSIIRINQDGSYTKIGLSKMDSWMKNNIVQGTFTPSLLANNDDDDDNAKKPLPLHLEYDPIHKDLYIIINGDDSIEENCLIYNEILDAFTSFVSCGKMYNLFVNNGQLYSIGNIVNPQVYKMFAGIYNTTYDGVPIDYYMQFRLNPAPYSDKTFTNVEFNADVNTSEYLNENERMSLISPFTHIQAWNEYQNSGSVPLQKTYANPLVSYRNNVPKFRTWRALIPRDDKDEIRNPYGLNRIRNPWIHLKLSNKIPENYKMEFHNMVVQYLE